MDNHISSKILYAKEERVLATEAAEESLSLSDLPEDTTEPDEKNFINTQYPPHSTEQSEKFEFFSDLSFEMSHAEDIFFCGKLIPLQEKPLSDDHHKLQGLNRRRCESMSEKKPRVMRNSRSLDGKTMRSSSMSYEKTRNIRRVSSDKSSEKSDASGTMRSNIVSKPKWYLLMFGIVKFPQEMVLEDIKSRQTRRDRKPGTPSIFPVNDQRSDRKSWYFLKMLSCKSHASVAVTAPIGQQWP